MPPFQLDICVLNQDQKKGKEPSVAWSLQSLLLSCPSIFWALQEGLRGNSLHQTTENEEFCCFRPIPSQHVVFSQRFGCDTTSFCSSSQPHLSVATNPHRNRALAAAELSIAGFGERRKGEGQITKKKSQKKKPHIYFWKVSQTMTQSPLHSS